ncbi:MAG TPA: hypothetical protein VG759_05765 [Candidatus Angelobacter sp.]|jgi:hypothetical protein|nr:hypothetical protein [Candidatus Angelobacter sp.]
MNPLSIVSLVASGAILEQLRAFFCAQGMEQGFRKSLIYKAFIFKQLRSACCALLDVMALGCIGSYKIIYIISALKKLRCG